MHSLHTLDDIKLIYDGNRIKLGGTHAHSWIISDFTEQMFSYTAILVGQ